MNYNVIFSCCTLSQAQKMPYFVLKFIKHFIVL